MAVVKRPIETQKKNNDTKDNNIGNNLQILKKTFHLIFPISTNRQILFD